MAIWLIAALACRISLSVPDDYFDGLGLSTGRNSDRKDRESNRGDGMTNFLASS